MTAPRTTTSSSARARRAACSRNRLTEDPDVRVLLLEAGGRDDYHWIHIPVGYLYCIDNPRTDWRYRTRAEPRAQRPRRCSIRAGACWAAARRSTA